MAIRLLLDTDIGSDVDDELTLVAILGSPEFDLVGVTTSYGDTDLRARIATRLAEMCGRTISVIRGVAAPISGREVWWAGHEGSGYTGLDEVMVRDDIDGPAFLAANAGADVDLLCIAPLTTVATATPLIGSLRGITIMGGDFGADRQPEHNILSDIDAAGIVFEREWPITVVGLEITRQVHLVDSDLVSMAGAGPAGELLADAARAWMQRWNEDFEVPHDPVTAMTLLRPDLFSFSEYGRVNVADDGRTDFVAGAGRTRIVTAVNAPAVAELILERVVAGVSGP